MLFVLCLRTSLAYNGNCNFRFWCMLIKCIHRQFVDCLKNFYFYISLTLLVWDYIICFQIKLATLYVDVFFSKFKLNPVNQNSKLLRVKVRHLCTSEWSLLGHITFIYLQLSECRNRVRLIGFGHQACSSRPLGYITVFR